MTDEPIQLEKLLEQYLDDISVRLGFCLYEEQRNALLADPGKTASQFVIRVMEAEGVSPEMHKHHFRNLREMLISKVGGEVLDPLADMLAQLRAIDGLMKG